MLKVVSTTKLLQHIVAYHPPNDVLVEDKCLWCPSANGKFSIKYAYKSISQFVPSHVVIGWKEVWNTDLPPRIKHFIWLVLHCKILTNCEMVRRKLTNDAGCLLCGCTQETVLHVLRDC